MATESSSSAILSEPIAASAFPKGWRLHLITFAICWSVLLSTLEISIVSTSLASISNDLDGFNRASWIVTIYLVNYTGFVIIYAKLSDVLGRKPMIIAAVIVFSISSGACGAAQNIVQLIVFRAFQGIGGSGIYSMACVFIPELVPAEKYAKYTSILSSTFALAFLIGPLIGGAINENTTWRWVFILNVPAGFLALVLLTAAIPANFPNQALDEPHNVISKDRIRRIDFLGFASLLSASVLLIVALEEAALQDRWRSPMIICFLILSGILIIGFLCWENFVTREDSVQEPVFPWRFIQNRVFMGILINSFLVGFPFTVAIIGIPQRFQAVNGITPFGAGYRLLPFAVLTPVGAALAGPLTSKLRIAPLYVLLLGTVCQTVGAALLSTLPTTSHTVLAAQYGYQAIMGLGCGLNLTILILLAPSVAGKKDVAVAIGAANQFRLLGGAIGLGICTNILASKVKTNLSPVLSSEQLKAILLSFQSIEALGPAAQATVRTVYAEGYNLQMRVLIGISAAEILATLMMWERKQGK